MLEWIRKWLQRWLEVTPAQQAITIAVREAEGARAREIEKAVSAVTPAIIAQAVAARARAVKERGFD